MNVYQVLQHEYNSDDGHYESSPLGDVVYSDQVAAIQVRDSMNLSLITQNNDRVRAEVARRRAHREANGNVDPPVVNRHGIQYHDCYSKRGIADYERKSLFTGDPTDLDAIERFVGWDNCMTYFTYEPLRVV